VRTVNQQWRFELLTKELVLVGQQDALPRKLGLLARKRMAVPAQSGISP
jgi:hypothetical protein